MKKLTIPLFSILLSFNSYGELVEVGENSVGDTIYIDTDTIKERGGYVYWWQVTDFLKPSITTESLSVKVYNLGDCGGNQFNPLSYIWYKQPMGKGDSQTDNSPNSWIPTTLGTINNQMFDYVCNYEKSKTMQVPTPHFIRVPVDDDVSNEDVEEAMESIANSEGIRSVGKLPISDMLVLQTGQLQRFLKIFQFGGPRPMMSLVADHPELSHLIPIRISLIEDKEGKRWLYSINLYYYYKDLSRVTPEYLVLLNEVVRIINSIMISGAVGDF